MCADFRSTDRLYDDTVCVHSCAGGLPSIERQSRLLFLLIDVRCEGLKTKVKNKHETCLEPGWALGQVPKEIPISHDADLTNHVH